MKYRAGHCNYDCLPTTKSSSSKGTLCYNRRSPNKHAALVATTLRTAGVDAWGSLTTSSTRFTLFAHPHHHNTALPIPVANLSFSLNHYYPGLFVVYLPIPGPQQSPPWPSIGIGFKSPNATIRSQNSQLQWPTKHSKSSQPTCICLLVSRNSSRLIMGLDV